MRIFSKIKHIYFIMLFFCFNCLRKIGIKIKISENEKQYIICRALKTEEGREALAKAMLGV